MSLSVLVVGIILLSISLAIVEKNILKASDIVLGGSFCLVVYIYRDIICVFDLIFTLIRDLTAP